MKNPLPGDVRRRLLLYHALFPLALLAMLPGLVRRMRKRGGYRADFQQRFGRYEPALVARLQALPRVWIQSISVGETVIALKLAAELRARRPAWGVVISVQTSTGYEIARRAAPAWLEVIYNPLDLSAFTRRAVATVRPRQFIIVEGMWPNLLAACRRAGAPAALIARLSPRAARRFQQFRWFTAPFFRLLDPICVAENDDLARWEALGARPGQLAVTGNLKYDEPPPDPARVAEFAAFLRALGVPESAPVLLGGSTFAGEEKILAECFLALRPAFPQLFLILAPRHFERTAEILAELQSLPLQIARRTKPPVAGADALIIDTTGELRTWYQLATVAFIGKSLTARGGQNPVEPALAGCAVVFGPHMENFAAITTRWLEHEAALQIPDAAALREKVAGLLGDAARRFSMVERARSSLKMHQGAIQRSVQKILA